MLLIIIFILVFASVALLIQVLLPLSLNRYSQIQEKKADEAYQKLDDLFVDVKKRKLLLAFILSPLILAGISLLIFHSLLIMFCGAVLGLALPNMFIKLWEKKRRDKFQIQLLDALMILSSSLKGGLSLLQAVEVVAEEMPPPICQEFGLILRENKMGITLEESLKRLNKRMDNMEELVLMINSVLVARETGGDLTKVLSRLSTTIRDNRKLKDSVKTLTLQGRMQGLIMSILPFIFIGWIITFNRNHFDIMLKTEFGRMLLILAVILQVIGLILIRKFSTIKV